MPRVRDVLHRFRPSGAPGAATSAGVPVDRAGELAAELEPVFALLAPTERECAQILDRAEREAARALVRDAERVAAVLASGRARVEVERSSAAAQARGARRPGGDDSVVAGGPAGQSGQAGQPGEVDAELTQYVDVVVATVRSLLGQGSHGSDPLAGAR